MQEKKKHILSEQKPHFYSPDNPKKKFTFITNLFVVFAMSTFVAPLPCEMYLSLFSSTFYSCCFSSHLMEALSAFHQWSYFILFASLLLGSKRIKYTLSGMQYEHAVSTSITRYTRIHVLHFTVGLHCFKVQVHWMTGVRYHLASLIFCPHICLSTHHQIGSLSLVLEDHLEIQSL